MDINSLRIIITLATFAAFVGIVVWAYRPSRKRDLERIGESILEDRQP